MRGHGASTSVFLLLGRGPGVVEWEVGGMRRNLVRTMKALPNEEPPTDEPGVNRRSRTEGAQDQVPRALSGVVCTRSYLGTNRRHRSQR